MGNIGYNEIKLNGAKSVAEMIKKNTKITKLDLGYNKIQSLGSKEIFDSIQTSSPITNLDLSIFIILIT